jgi:hypothetical protein
MSEIKVEDQSSPAETIKLTRRGKVAAAIAGAGLTAGALMGLNAIADSSDSRPQHDNVHRTTDEMPPYIGDADTKEVKVKPGDGVDRVIQRAYGIEAPDGTNPVVQNNPAYEQEYAAIVEANNGSEELTPGTLPVPKEFYSQEQIQQMQENK